jgi:hypothetical protein
MKEQDTAKHTENCQTTQDGGKGEEVPWRVRLTQAQYIY